MDDAFNKVVENVVFTVGDGEGVGDCLNLGGIVSPGAIIIFGGVGESVGIKEVCGDGLLAGCDAVKTGTPLQNSKIKLAQITMNVTKTEGVFFNAFLIFFSISTLLSPDETE